MLLLIKWSASLNLIKGSLAFVLVIVMVGKSRPPAGENAPITLALPDTTRSPDTKLVPRVFVPIDETDPLIKVLTSRCFVIEKGFKLPLISFALAPITTTPSLRLVPAAIVVLEDSII